MQSDTGFCGKLFERKSSLFSPHREQIADSLDFKWKRLVMEEYPRFLVVFDVNSALCKCQMRAWAEGTQAILRVGRGNEGAAPERVGGFEFERACLRPHLESGADGRRSCRSGKNLSDHVSEAIQYRSLDRQLWV
jgi:hypothetical protein